MTLYGYNGWGQRSPDFGHSSLGGPPAGDRQRGRVTRPLAVLIAAAVLAVVALVVLRADGADDDRVAAELEQRSQPPVLHEARLVEDRLELDVDGPDDADRYCLASPALIPDDRGQPPCTVIRGAGYPWFPLEDLDLDADELVGRDIVVTAHSTVPDEGDGALAGFTPQVTSEPSEPVEIVDAR